MTQTVKRKTEGCRKGNGIGVGIFYKRGEFIWNEKILQIY